MAKKFKIKLNGLTVSADTITDADALARVYTLAALHEREVGHLANHEVFMNIAINIKDQITEQA